MSEVFHAHITSTKIRIANINSPKTDQGRRVSVGSQGHSAISPDRPTIPSPRSHPPPTPPLPPASSFDFPRGPDGNVSPTSAPTRNNYYPTTPSSTNPELYAQRSSYPPLPEPGSSYPPLPDANSWGPARAPVEPAQQEPIRPVVNGQPDPVENGQYPGLAPGLAQQRPLPMNFPPPIPGQGGPPIDPQMAPPTWQHHHYYPPTNPPSYPQTQERYICPTCSKPFSRPSSLKIHTYSHTGEKPYKCKHEGCGKQFSVRSNMKRHEKGCHGGESASTSGASPKTS